MLNLDARQFSMQPQQMCTSFAAHACQNTGMACSTLLLATAKQAERLSVQSFCTTSGGCSAEGVVDVAAVDALLRHPTE